MGLLDGFWKLKPDGLDLVAVHDFHKYFSSSIYLYTMMYLNYTWTQFVTFY